MRSLVYSIQDTTTRKPLSILCIELVVLLLQVTSRGPGWTESRGSNGLTGSR